MILFQIHIDQCDCITKLIVGENNCLIIYFVLTDPRLINYLGKPLFQYQTKIGAKKHTMTLK